MREVEVDVLSQRESTCHFVERSIHVGTAGREIVEVALKSSVDLFNETNTDASASGRRETIVPVELEVDAVFET